MKMIAINKHSSKLKVCSVEMPNAPYLNRCGALKKETMKHKILGIDKIEELDSFEEPLRIRIHLKYPNYKDLLNQKPSERIKAIRQRKRDRFKEFTSTIEKEFNRIGSKVDPSGLEIICSKTEILKYNKDKRIENISILVSDDKTDFDFESIELYYAVVARFAIQIENRTKGLQDYEDRILMIKAKSGEEAERKLKKGFKSYEKPYLNPLGELVRWKFEEFIDWYETSYDSLEDMLNDDKEGIEIFSRLKSRRLNKDRAWIIENEK
jgi:hypothetical protein